MNSVNGISYYLSKCQTLSNTSQMTLFLSERQCIGAYALCMQHITTAAALSTSFLWNHVPIAQALITRFRESCSSVSTSPESKRLKKSRSDELAMH